MPRRVLILPSVHRTTRAHTALPHKTPAAAENPQHIKKEYLDHAGRVYQKDKVVHLSLSPFSMNTRFRGKLRDKIS